MRKLIAIVVFVLAGFATTHAQNSAKFEFESETIDYGIIKKVATECVSSNLKMLEMNHLSLRM